ncbi:MAG: hypothetical protein SFT94_03710 [Pseudanabaenaceae cyanobacterium bins.68]|nr:hypothetical protein [Pseudanabaenaceae cyanobacterium bins.68]
MKREVISELLNLTGIEAIALATRKIRPVIYGLSDRLDPRQKIALGQGILQILEDADSDFTQFELYFHNHTVFIYKQNSGLILMIIASPGLEQNQYKLHVGRFRQLLEQDIYNAVTLFKQISGSATQPSQNRDFSEPLLAPVSRQIVAPVSPDLNPGPPSLPPPDPNRSLQTWLEDLNQIGGCASEYLGKMIAGNYWKSSRDSGWLEEFTIDRQGKLSHPQPQKNCTLVEERDLEAWVRKYVQQCQKVLRNFDQILRQKQLKFAHIQLEQVLH